jgi:hypothetical protein
MMKTKCCIFSSPVGTPEVGVVVVVGVEFREVVVVDEDEGVTLDVQAIIPRLIARIITSARNLFIMYFGIGLLL